jgi:hypothetical protein
MDLLIFLCVRTIIETTSRQGGNSSRIDAYLNGMQKSTRRIQPTNIDTTCTVLVIYQSNSWLLASWLKHAGDEHWSSGICRCLCFLKLATKVSSTGTKPQSLVLLAGYGLGHICFSCLVGFAHWKRSKFDF